MIFGVISFRFNHSHIEHHCITKKNKNSLSYSTPVPIQDQCVTKHQAAGARVSLPDLSLHVRGK